MLEPFQISITDAILDDLHARLRGEVDGSQLHVIHEKGRGSSPLPLVLTHGYPDSFFRFYKLIPLLTDPVAHGGDSTDAFDVVVPSLPGYGFSAPRASGGGMFGFGDLWHHLMTAELGYERFGAHGGDWGSTVTELLARSHASSVIGIHLTDVPFWHLFQKTNRPQQQRRAVPREESAMAAKGGCLRDDPGHSPAQPRSRSK
jgi:pimeloyl-ACP methyl ester carboxylesterase